MPLWDEVKANLVEWYTVASDKTGELAKVGVRKYDKFGISRDVERQFSELGSFVYNALDEGREDFLQDPTLLAIVERVKVLEEELRRKEEEISTIRSEYRDRAESKRTAARPDAGAGAQAGPDPAAPTAPDENSGGAEDLPEGDSGDVDRGETTEAPHPESAPEAADEASHDDPGKPA